MSKDMERLTEALEEHAIATNDFDVIAAESIAEGVLESTWLAERDAALIEELADEAAVEVEPDAPDDFLRGFDAGADAVYAFLREKARQRREGQNQ